MSGSRVPRFHLEGSSSPMLLSSVVHTSRPMAALQFLVCYSRRLMKWRDAGRDSSTHAQSIR